MNTGTDIHRVLINARGICQAMPEFAPRHESLYSRGSHFNARFFRAVKEGKQLSGNPRRKYDSRLNET